jgi:DNA-directed RNA polymerase specialized sigma24 family protein
MKQAEQAESFEQVLLSYVDLCYSVALTMTRDPNNAQDLTRDVVSWAWHLRDKEDAHAEIKMKLLSALRARYIQRYRNPVFALASQTAIAESV